MQDERTVPLRELILVPALITLAITLLRLVGELLNLAPSLFGKEAGGGGALVGIAWLVPFFGAYFGFRLAREGFTPPSVWRTIGSAVGALALIIVTVVLTVVLEMPQLAGLFVIGAVCLVAVWIAARAWPALGKTLVAYALAARIPVAIVMLVAILGRWGTHYDVSPPENAAVIDAWNPLVKWFVIGVVPQLTMWIAFTVVLGAIFGAIAAAVARRSQPAATGAA